MEKIYLYVKEKLQINNRTLGTIRNEFQEDKQLLIYIHGGPLFPEIYLIDKFFPELLEEFNCIFPDQYDCGLSYTSENKPLTLKEYTYDIIELTKHYLRKTGSSSCILLGSSFGTTTGLMAVSEAEHLYSHYIAIGQIKIIYESMKAAREYIIKHSNHKNIDSIAKTEPAIEYIFSSKYINPSMKILNTLGKQNTYKVKFTNLDTLKALFFFKEYSLKEKVNVLRSLFDNRIRLLFEELAVTDMQIYLNQLSTPALIIL